MADFTAKIRKEKWKVIIEFFQEKKIVVSDNLIYMELSLG